MAAPTDAYRQHLAEALARADADIGQLRAEAAELQRELTACRVERAQLRTDLEGVTGSLSWRASAPLRSALAHARTLRARR